MVGYIFSCFRLAFPGISTFDDTAAPIFPHFGCTGASTGRDAPVTHRRPNGIGFGKKSPWGPDKIFPDNLRWIRDWASS